MIYKDLCKIFVHCRFLLGRPPADTEVPNLAPLRPEQDSNDRKFCPEELIYCRIGFFDKIEISAAVVFEHQDNQKITCRFGSLCHRYHSFWTKRCMSKYLSRKMELLILFSVREVVPTEAESLAERKIGSRKV